MAAPHLEIVNLLAAPAVHTDAAGRITHINPAAVALLGGPPKLGEMWTTAFPLSAREGDGEVSPVQAAMRSGEPARADQFLTYPDGRRVPVRLFCSPVHGLDGAVTGVITVLTDLVSQGPHGDDAERLAAIVTSSDDAIISKTLDGVITSWNAGAERIFGYEAQEMIGQSILRLIPPHLADEEKVIIAALTQGKRVDHYETVRITRDGRLVNVSLTVSPLRDANGRITGASKVARDVTERKRAEEVQRLLVDELNHRIKNTLATVQAIATQTLRRAPSPTEFVANFNGRIQALARAHGLLTNSTFQGAEIQELIRDQLMLGGADDHRISCRGPKVTLEPQTALHLALVLHELGTNARKHGALSLSQGQVDVRWEVGAAGGRRLNFTWIESGGPPVRAPTASGFGMTLIEQSLKAHGGEASMRFSDTGIQCAISLPMHEGAVSANASDEDEVKAAPVEAAPRGVRGKRVLVVEDEALIAMVMADYLEDAGAALVGPAQTIESARLLIEQGDFDLALLDANLSGRSVEGLAAALTARGAPFAFVTGYGREGLPEGFREAIMVEKPFTQEQVLAALDRLASSGDNAVPV